MTNRSFVPSTPAERAYDLYLRACEYDAENRGWREIRKLYLDALAIGAGLSDQEQGIALARLTALNPEHVGVVIPFRRPKGECP